MDNTVGSTIEMIKLQEQEKEAKLKEKRELEATLASLNRAIRDMLQQTEKFKQEEKDLVIKIDSMRAQLEVERTHRDTLLAQLSTCQKQLDELRIQSDHGISKVWEMRSSLCETVQKVSEECDIWALLVRPTCTDLPRTIKKPEIVEPKLVNGERLRNAVERRDKARAERDRLLTEPDAGEEFVRTYFRLNRPYRNFSSKVEASENEPIRFSTSPAAQKTVVPVIRQPQKDMPWYQPYSVVASVAVFLIYFCILREESDVDLEFNKTLYDRIKGLEKEQLIQSYKFNKEHGKETADIEKRLRELEVEESKAIA